MSWTLSAKEAVRVPGWILNKKSVLGMCNSAVSVQLHHVRASCHVNNAPWGRLEPHFRIRCPLPGCKRERRRFGVVVNLTHRAHAKPQTHKAKNQGTGKPAKPDWGFHHRSPRTPKTQFVDACVRQCVTFYWGSVFPFPPVRFILKSPDLPQVPPSSGMGTVASPWATALGCRASNSPASSTLPRHIVID